jgi:hypothetical protein
MTNAPITQGYSFAYRRKNGTLDLERAADNINVLVYRSVKDSLMDLKDQTQLGMEPVLVRVTFEKPVIVGLARLPKSHL